MLIFITEVIKNALLSALWMEIALFFFVVFGRFTLMGRGEGRSPLPENTVRFSLEMGEKCVDGG